MNIMKMLHDNQECPCKCGHKNNCEKCGYYGPVTKAQARAVKTSIPADAIPKPNTKVVADQNVEATMTLAQILLPKGSHSDHVSFADRVLKLASKYRLLDHI
jgi:hypothetical protein